MGVATGRFPPSPPSRTTAPATVGTITRIARGSKRGGGQGWGEREGWVVLWAPAAPTRIRYTPCTTTPIVPTGRGMLQLLQSFSIGLQQLLVLLLQLRLLLFQHLRLLSHATAVCFLCFRPLLLQFLFFPSKVLLLQQLLLLSQQFLLLLNLLFQQKLPFLKCVLLLTAQLCSVLSLHVLWKVINLALQLCFFQSVITSPFLFQGFPPSFLIVDQSSRGSDFFS